MSKTIVHTDKAPAPIGPYNQGIIVAGTLVFTAGQIPLNPKTGTVVGVHIATQTQQALENLKAILEQAGATLESVVKTTVFLKDMNEFADMNKVYGDFFKNNTPARTTVEVSRLPKDVRIEIEAIAEVVA